MGWATVSRAVWGVDAATPPDAGTTVRAERVVREAGLIVLVAAVTRVTATDWTDTYWTSVDFSAQPYWTWAPVGGAILVTLLRLWLPAVAVVAAAGLLGWWPASGIALAVTAVEVSAQVRSLRWRVSVLGLAAVTGYGSALLSAQGPTVLVTQFHLITALVCLVLPAGVQALRAKADRVVHALRERTHYLEENYRLAQSTARLQERTRIAQEMHDQLGHRLSLISLYAGALELASAEKSPTVTSTMGQPPVPGGEAKLIRNTVQTAMQELRTVLGVLSSAAEGDVCGDVGSAALQPVEDTGLRPDIERLAEQSRSAGVRVRLTWQGDDLRDVAVPVRRAVHRVTREGLANVHRHAPGSTVTITVERGPDSIRVDVSDRKNPAAAPDARPLQPGTGLGLAGVRERVSLLGGDFSAGPTRDGGFLVTAELPLHAQADTRPPTEGAQPGHPAHTAADGVPPTEPVGIAEQHAPADRWVRHGTSAVLALGLVGVAALVGVALTSLPWYAPQPSVEQPPPVRVAEVGMTREEAKAAIGPDDPLARLAARSVESPPPASDVCTYTQEWLLDGSATIVRYCFRQDHLVGKDRYEAGDGLSGRP